MNRAHESPRVRAGLIIMAKIVISVPWMGDFVVPSCFRLEQNES